MNKRPVALGVIAVTLVAGVVAGRERPAVELPQPRAPQAAAALDNDLDLDKLRRAEVRAPSKDPFAVMKGPEPKIRAAAAAPEAPAKPTAPPLPFQYVGKWSQGDKSEVLVQRGDELLPIEPGAKLGDYRVDQITEARVSFTYLPLNMKQTLDVPAP
jgi:hypothetical protein